MSAHESLNQHQFNIEHFPPASEMSACAAVKASVGDERIGGLSWVHRPGTEDHGRVMLVAVHPEHQRKGVATALFNHVKTLGVPIHHATSGLSEDGKAWSATVR